MKKFGVLIIGVIFLCAGVFMYLNHDRLSKVCTEEAEATVIDMKEKIDTSSEDDVIRYLYYPVIEYNANNEKVEVTMSSGTSTPAYRINDKFTILYNPNKTSEYIIKGDKATNIISLIFIGLGLVISIIGFIVIFKKAN